MQIVKHDRYLQELETIVHFIARDSLDQAIAFAERLNAAFLHLPDMPYRCRPSTKSNNPNIRDMIFEGYVIPYRINLPKERIEILGIFSQNRWEM